MLKDAKKYLFKLNNNQRVDYQLEMFKVIFIRIVINMIKKTSSVTTTASITRVISITETIFILAIKSKQKIISKEFMCYICNKIDHYRKNCTIQNQIKINKKILKKNSIILSRYRRRIKNKQC